MPTIAEELAHHVVARRKDSPPSAPAIDEIERLVVDYFGVALGGSTTAVTRIATEFQLAYGAHPGEATILGHDHHVSAQGAAFVNAVAAHSMELDDTDPLSMLHFGSPVVSAALAAAEVRDASGAEFLTAVVAGCEVMQAISDAVNPGMRDRGYHCTAVCGVFGAAAAAAALFELDEEQTVSAFGAAGAQAAGLFDVYGPSMQKRLQPGFAAQNGVVSARIAAFGFRGANTIFDGEHGVFNVFTADSDSDSARRRLAQGAPLGIELKPYACFRPLHAAIDAALWMRTREVFSAEAITGITLARHPQWARYHINASPSTTYEAQGSINHAIAVALIEGAALLDQFGTDRIDDPRVQRLSRMIEVEVDENLARGDSCRLRLAFDDGRSVERQVDYPSGSNAVPMSAADRDRKLSYLTSSLLTPERAVELVQAIGGLRREVRVRDLIHAARVSTV